MNIPITSFGSCIATRGSGLLVHLPIAAIGDYCEITVRSGRIIPAEVIAVQPDCTVLFPLGEIAEMTPGDVVRCVGKKLTAKVPADPRGFMLDAFGNVTNISSVLPTESSPNDTSAALSICNAPPPPMGRRPVNKQAVTGVRVIDTLLPIAEGQRLGIFASAGTGKSTLLTSIAQHIKADVRVIALIGERGREVKEFVDALDEETRKRTVIVSATSDELPSKRMLAAYTAMAIAERYRAAGQHVLFMMDSLTRFARAARDVGLTAGEIPVRQGYPASVYTKLPQLIERAGTDAYGAITALFTVLTNQDGTEDPLADEIKSLLDGHFYLSNALVAKGIRPAIDLDRSISRVNDRLLTREQIGVQKTILRKVHRLVTDQDLLLFGGQPDEELAQIIANENHIKDFLCQLPDEASDIFESQHKIGQLLERLL